MIKVGLTGGIGSGKSLASEYFSNYGATIVDADRISWQITQPDSPAFKEILCHFGPEILSDNGHLDRKKIRSIIFNNPFEKKWLEETLHPTIRTIMHEQSKIADSAYTIIVIPLLSKSSNISFLDRVLVIDAPTNLQQQRTLQRDNIPEDLAKLMIKKQISREQRLSLANDIVVNNGEKSDLKFCVNEIHEFYLKLSNSLN